MDISKYSKEELEAEIKRREEEEKNKKAKLPKELVIYSHGSDEDWESIMSQGFTEEQIDKYDLDNLAYEIALRFIISEDGKKTLIGINGVLLAEPIGWN